MKTTYMNFAKRFAMMLAVVIVAVNVWGDEAALSPAANPGGSPLSLDDNDSHSWVFTLDDTGTLISWNSGTGGVQVGSGSRSTTGFTVASSGFTNATVTSVVVRAKTNGSGTVNVQINGSDFGTSGAQTLTGSFDDYTFSGNVKVTGDISVILNRSETAQKNFILASITVTYSTGYTITWDNGGHGTAPTTPTNATTLTMPTISDGGAGCTFRGWTANVAVKNTSTNADISAGTLITSSTGITVSQNTTFTAQWSYTVTCNVVNGSYGSISQSSVTNVLPQTPISASGNVLSIGTTDVTATAKAKDDDYSYGCSGWTGLPAGGKVTGPVTVTATFTRSLRSYTNYRTACIETYSVTYNGNGAEDGSEPTDNNDYAVDAEVTVLGNAGGLVLTNYTFAGWNTKADGTGDNYTAGGKFNITKNTTLYAKWNCAYSVNVSAGTPVNGTFNLSNTGAIATCEEGFVINVTPIPNTGYQLDEVTVDGVGSVDGTTVTYAALANETSEINVTFAAKTYGITLDREGATTGSESVTMTYNSATHTAITAPNKDGHTFGGWWSEDNGTGSMVMDADGVLQANVANFTDADGKWIKDATCTLYAKWTIKTYNVTWMVGNNEAEDGLQTKSVEHGQKVTVLPEAPLDNTLSSCGKDKFMGWSTTDIGEVGLDKEDDADDIAALKLFKTADSENIEALSDDEVYYAVFAKGEDGMIPEAHDYSHTIISKTWDAAGSQTLNGVSWDLDVTGTSYYGYDATKGQQIGSGTYPASEMTLSTSEISGTIKSIKIYTSGAQSINATVSVSVNGEAYSCNSSTNPVEISSTNTDYEFTGEEEGTILISWSNSSSKAMYFKRIDIEYTTLVEGTVYSSYVTKCGTAYSITKSGIEIGKVFGIEGNLTEACAGTVIKLTKEEEGSYKWVSWNVENENGDPVSVTNDRFVMPASSVTITAEWAEKGLFSLRLMSLGREQEKIDDILEGASIWSLISSKTAPAMTDYICLGWSTVENDKTAIINSHSSAKLTGNTTLYAVYQGAKGAYVKVTSTEDITDGQYLIVYEDGELAFNGGLETLDASSNYIDVTISDDAIAVTDETTAAEFTIATMTGGHSIKSASGKYIDRTSGTTSGGMNVVENNPNAHSLSIDNSGNFVDEGTVGTLKYNTASNQYRFRYYVSGQEEIQLYKKTAYPDPAAEPVSVPTLTVAYNETANTDELYPDGVAGNIVVETGGKVTGTNTLTVNNVLIKTSLGTINAVIDETVYDNKNGKSGEIVNPDKITATGEVWIEIELTQETQASAGWYAFSVPFPVDAMNGVYYGSTKLVNEKGYAIMSHHGDLRAENKYAWKKYRDILQPGVFYVITVGNTDYKTLRFKKVDGAAIFNEGNVVSENQMTITSYPSSDTYAANWNGMGNPYLETAKVGSTYMQFYDHGDNVFRQRTGSDVQLMVGSAFFLQSAESTISVTRSDEGSILLAPARTPKAIEETIFEVRLNDENGREADNLFLTAREDATNEYEIGRDVAKMSMGTAKCAQMWVPAYGTQLGAADFQLVNDKAEYPLVINTPKAGTYTMSTVAKDNADLYLTYEGSIIWNLSMGAYEIELAKGTTNGYGLLLQAKAPSVVTGVDQLDNGDWTLENVQKVIIDEHVFILRGGQMYDVTGKAVK